MCPSIVNRNKLSLPSIQRRLRNLKKLNWKFKLFIALLICTVTTILIYLPGKRSYLEQVFNVLKGVFGGLPQKEKIIILEWTPFWGTVFPPTLFNSNNCSILKTATTQRPPISRIFDIPCTITRDRRRFNESDAVVYHSPDLNYRPPYSKLSEGLRPQNQIWVWYQGESPLITVVNPNAYKHVFNWTMSYRRDSDVYYPYAYIVPSPTSQLNAQENQTDHYRKLLKKKSGLAAWIVSNCNAPSRRKYFVNELQKYIPVDTFGKCGQNKCPQPKTKGFHPCYNHIQFKYKFYLSFENSLCVDYITEKFFLALQTDMVPVVYGGGIDDQMGYLAIAPEKSFIDARDFKSPHDLANYLIYLDKNDDEYLKYFEWKAKYQVVYKDYGQYGFGWCNLCQRIYEQIGKREEPSWNKWYGDLYTWWNYVGVSKNSQGLNTSQLELASTSKSVVSSVGPSLQYSLEQLKPACVLKKKNFTSYLN